MGRADRRGLTMTGVIDAGVEGGLRGGIGALAELQQHRHFLSLSGGVHSMAGRPHAALIMQFRALARSLN